MFRYAALLLLLAAPLCAQEEKPLRSGDTPPELRITYWLDVPSRTTLAEMAGDVILIKAWGKN
ncbi:MAG: hypothetical protein KBG84_02935 [Planctomycetes bacterium]|nr:hypothetical protein [Planctomycetota bacterium]